MWQTKHPMASSSFSVSNHKHFVHRHFCHNGIDLARVCRNVAFMSMVSALAACGGEPLYSELDEQQVNEMQAVLMNVGIAAEKEASPEGKAWLLTVPKTRIPDAMSVLAEQGLPQIAAPSIADVFRKEGFVSSPVEEHARYVYALSQELANTIMQLDGVAAARVHVALPKRALLDEEQQSASVSVVVIQKPGADLARYETDIKAIVTDGIEGLDDINRVTVKFFRRDARPSEHPVPEQTITAPLVAGAGATGLILLGGGFGLGQWWRGRRRSTNKTKLEFAARA